MNEHELLHDRERGMTYKAQGITFFERDIA
jgi:hypothetical protein